MSKYIVTIPIDSDAESSTIEAIVNTSMEDAGMLWLADGHQLTIGAAKVAADVEDDRCSACAVTIEPLYDKVPVRIVHQPDCKNVREYREQRQG